MPDRNKEAIIMIQRYLRQLSYTGENIPAPPIDGIYDTATAQAVRSFQAKEGVPQTGVVDRTTFDLLFRRYEESLRERSAPVPLAAFPRLSADYTLREGDESFLVRLIQYALGELELIYEGFESIPQSGIYDAATVEAVRGFQKRHSLPETGEVDRATWDALASVYNREFGGYQPQ